MDFVDYNLRLWDANHIKMTSFMYVATFRPFYNDDLLGLFRDIRKDYITMKLHFIDNMLETKYRCREEFAELVKEGKTYPFVEGAPEPIQSYITTNKEKSTHALLPMELYNQIMNTTKVSLSLEEECSMYLTCGETKGSRATSCLQKLRKWEQKKKAFLAYRSYFKQSYFSVVSMNAKLCKYSKLLMDLTGEVYSVDLSN
jgi:hypothetical protein